MHNNEKGVFDEWGTTKMEIAEDLGDEEVLKLNKQ